MKQQESATQFSDLYGRLLQQFAAQVEERGASYGRANQNVREELVRCLWFGSHFRPEQLATDDGRRLEVISPGWWNVEGGPDFIRAELLLEGSGRLVGDVEVHTNASAWYAHGHDRQPEYDDVVLHVVMWNDSEGRQILRHCGEPVPQLTLSRFVEEEIGELVEIVDLEGGPPEPSGTSVPVRYCGQSVAEGRLSLEWLGRLLDIAGDWRLLDKAERLHRLQQKLPLEQILYESVAEALGYKNNRMPFLQLTDLLPVRTLRETVPADAPPSERQEVLEAALYGAAGFLDEATGPPADGETASYLERLRARWEELPTALRERRMSPAHWSFSGTRPVNYPTRRIAALACLYAQHLPGGLFGHMMRVLRTAHAKEGRRLDTALRDALVGVLTELQHPYWSYRYTFGGTRLSRPYSLIGQERALSILVDVIIPLTVANAEAGEDSALTARLHRLWSGLPGRAPNTVLRRMRQTIFGQSRGGQQVVSSARRQQGLHQLYKDFCNTPGGCPSCILYLAHRAGEELTEG